jgi:hypothetical protein
MDSVNPVVPPPLRRQATAMMAGHWRPEGYK